MSETDTPRTEAAVVIRTNGYGEITPYVDAHISRTLERELSAANARIKELEMEYKELLLKAHERTQQAEAELATYRSVETPERPAVFNLGHTLPDNSKVVLLDAYDRLEAAYRRSVVEGEKDRKDAERYRWLRDHANNRGSEIEVTAPDNNAEGTVWYGTDGSALDAAIDSERDAALAAGEGKEEG